MPDDLGNDSKLINDGGEITGQGAGDGPVQVADFTNDPAEVIEGRTPQQQAADAEQAAREGSISATTPEEMQAADQRQEALYQKFDQGYFPEPGTADWWWFTQWQIEVRNGRRPLLPTEEERQHPVEEF